jgi:ABC-type lipopolysaccharide export system ATPase subunit
MRKLQTFEISKAYRGRKVVDDVSVLVEQGEVVGLLGPNGAGKTTSFYMIVGLISPDSGRVMLDDEEITGLPMFQRARRGISYLPQEPSVFRKLTVDDNLMAILETLPISGHERRERMNRLDGLDASARLDRVPDGAPRLRAVLADAERRGLLEREGARVRLTRRGRLLADEVFGELLAP